MGHNESRAARYLRISEDRAAKGKDDAGRAEAAALNSSLTGQRAKCQAIEEATGATDVTEYVDHDKSAAKGKPRQAYRALLDAITAGQVKRVYVLHTSRIWRNRRERAAGIEIFAKHHVALIPALGPALDFTTAAGRSMAALLGEFDTLESEIKAERIEVWHDVRAGKGLHAGGPAPYGYRYEPTGRLNAKGLAEHRLVPVPEQAEQVKAWFRRFLAGEPLTALAREAGVAHVVMRQRLTNPTYAGLRVHRGVEYPRRNPDGTPFAALVAVDQWRAAVATIEGRARGPRAPRHLLTGVAACDRGHGVVASASADRPLYRCRECGRTWRGDWCDDYVEAVVRERLSRPDARDLLTAAPTPDDRALADEAAGIRKRLAALATEHVLSGVDVTEAVEAGKRRLAEIDRLTGATAPDPALISVARAKSPVKAYDALETTGRQAVIRRLMTVTLMPGVSRGRIPSTVEDPQAWYLDRCVRIDWRRR